MSEDTPFEKGFEDPDTKGSVFGETNPVAGDEIGMEIEGEDEGADEGEGITSGTIEIARETLVQYGVPDKYHSEIIDLIDEMMMGKLGKELQEEAGFYDQLKAAIAKVEERHGLSFDIDYDDAE